MDLSFTAEDEAFRAEVRAFFETEYPQDILDKVRRGQALGKADLMASEAALNAKGWLAPAWPVEYGGPGWNITQRFIFDQEMQRVAAPLVVPMGLLYLGPTLFVYGSEEQKRRWLPDILSGKTFWAQGYSEPDSGSDLASLRTRADNMGDHYIVNGMKIWTSQAHYADWIFCLVRTSSEARKQDGITLLCIDMKTPGVEVHPIISIDGAHSLNRVSFTDVRVPIENRIGEEGVAWTYSRALLAHERTSYARLGAKRRDLDALKAQLVEEEDNEALRARFAETEIAYLSLEATTLRVLAPLAKGEAPTQAASALKILATETAQAITERNLERVGQDAAPKPSDRSRPDWTNTIAGRQKDGAVAIAQYFATRAETIYGGSTEVQKNILARQLGL